MTNQAIQLSREALQSLTLWTAADIAHVKEMIAPQANEQEFRLLLYMANKYELDPLLRQIWCVKYGAKPAQIFAGRDGFLAIAHRSGAFDGLDTTIRLEQVPIHIEYTYYDNGQKLTGILDRAFQYVATARAYNKSARHPVVVEVWEEEYSTGRDLWAIKPRTMLTKVAECQAVRKAFNISGLYEPSEMGHEGAIEGTAREIVADAGHGAVYTVPMLVDYMAGLGVTGDDTKTFIMALTEGRYRKLGEMDSTALGDFASRLNRFRNRDDAEYFLQHGTHPLDDPRNRLDSSPTPSDRVRGPQTVPGVVGVGPDPQPAPAPATRAPATQEPSTRVYTADDYRGAIKKRIAPLGPGSQQLALLNNLLFGATTAIRMDDPDATVDDALKRLDTGELKSLGASIKGLSLQTPDDLEEWLNRQAADVQPVAS